MTTSTACLAYSAYLRGKVCALGIGDQGEAALYADEKIPVRLRLAFTIGVTSKRRAPLLSESELERQVVGRLDLAKIVAELERDDSPPQS